MSDIDTTAAGAAGEFFARSFEGEGEADIIMDLVRRAFNAGWNLAGGNQWQDVSTAPKDGTKIILARFADEPADKNGYMLVDWWRDRNKDDVSYTGFGGFNEHYWPATHWMPLPSRPEPAAHLRPSTANRRTV